MIEITCHADDDPFLKLSFLPLDRSKHNNSDNAADNRTTPDSSHGQRQRVIREERFNQVRQDNRDRIEDAEVEEESNQKQNVIPVLHHAWHCDCEGFAGHCP